MNKSEFNYLKKVAKDFWKSEHPQSAYKDYVEDYIYRVNKLSDEKNYTELFTDYSGREMTKFLLKFGKNFSLDTQRKFDAIRRNKLTWEIDTLQLGLPI